MNKYKIEYKISTVTECAIMDNLEKLSSFSFEEILFSHWNFNHREGWISDAWLAESTVQSENYQNAFKFFKDKLIKIIPRIALISQSYITDYGEPFLIHKCESDVAFFQYTSYQKVVRLSFTEDQNRALIFLMKQKYIPEEFYYYWNDAVNSTGYSSKLLLMFSALEALVKRDGRKDWELLNKILGKNMQELYGTPQSSKLCIRNRLVHGDYFNEKDNNRNYLDLVHKKIMTYFNDYIFNKKLLNENIVNPQRHPFGNKAISRNFIKRKDKGTTFNLKDTLKDFDANKYSPNGFYEYCNHINPDSY